MKVKKLFISFILKIIVCFVILGIVLSPKSALSSAKNALSMWMNIIIPSLLPFIICANLVVSLKVTDILGIIINPLTKKIFNVSGKSGVVFAISMVSGYPVGSKLASELRLDNKISKYEGQRLVSFCSTSGPLFIIGSVATGMLKSPQIGYIMIICHYIGSILVGILFRGYGREKNQKQKNNTFKELKNFIYYSDNSEGFFTLFGSAVVSGVNTILAIGGFVIIFSVFFEILNYFQVINFISSFLFTILNPLNISKQLISAFLSGLFEMTIGCNSITQINDISPALSAALCNFLISFSGLSILAQSSSFIQKTDIKVGLYVFAKLLHATFAAIATYIALYLNSDLLVSSFNTTTKAYFIYYNLYIDSFKHLFISIILLYLFYQLKSLYKKII